MSERPLPSTIAAPVEHELVIKKSIFLAHLAPVTDLSQADAVIQAIRKDRWDARHHCTALVIGEHADRQRSNDDGEPSGTAGVPMLEVLKHRDLTDVVVVVSRWFGGILLGAGGLVRAYGSAVSGVVDRAALVSRARLTHLSMTVPHAEAGRVLAFLHGWAEARGARVDVPAYGTVATLGIRVAPELLADFEADLAAVTAGSVAATQGETTVVDLPG